MIFFYDSLFQDFCSCYPEHFAWCDHARENKVRCKCDITCITPQVSWLDFTRCDITPQVSWLDFTRCDITPQVSWLDVTCWDITPQVSRLDFTRCDITPQVSRLDFTLGTVQQVHSWQSYIDPPPPKKAHKLTSRRRWWYLKKRTVHCTPNNT